MLDRLIVLLIATVVVAAFLAAVIGFAFWYRNKFGVQLWVSFLQRSGFRRAENPMAPLDQQARAILAEMGHPTGAVRGPWVRTVGAWNVRYRSWTHVECDKPVTEQVWLLQLEHPVGFQMQILERSRSAQSFLGTLASTALGRNRRWEESLREEPGIGRIPFDDTSGSFDERFVVRTDSPADARSFLTSPAVRAAIMALPEVFLVVAGEWLTVDDPTGAVHRKLVGLSAITPGQILDREVAMHDFVVDKLSAMAQPLSKRPAPVASAPAIVKHALPGKSPASFPGRVESFSSEQGFGTIRLADGREVSFDISHSTAPLQQGDSVQVQVATRDGRLVAVCVWLPDS